MMCAYTVNKIQTVADLLYRKQKETIRPCKVPDQTFPAYIAVTSSLGKRGQSQKFTSILPKNRD